MTRPQDDGGSGNGTSEEAARIRKGRRRTKNIALLLALVAFAVLIYIVSIVRMSGA